MRIIQIIFLALYGMFGVIRQLIPKLAGYNAAFTADTFRQIH
jgi:hypothetical protein